MLVHGVDTIFRTGRKSPYRNLANHLLDGSCKEMSLFIKNLSKGMEGTGSRPLL